MVVTELNSLDVVNLYGEYEFGKPISRLMH